MDLNYALSPRASQTREFHRAVLRGNRRNGNLGFADFIDDVIDVVNRASHTFFMGYLSLRFTGPTRAFLGMQQWSQTCSVEMSLVPGVDGELEPLLTELYQWESSVAASRIGDSCWISAPRDAAASIPTFARGGRSTRRCRATSPSDLENDLARRWNLTTPERRSVRFPVRPPGTLDPGQPQAVTVTMRNTGVSTWTAASGISPYFPASRGQPHLADRAQRPPERHAAGRDGRVPVHDRRSNHAGPLRIPMEDAAG